ncbi:MAG TPA: hypothetical protein VGK99_03165 [Acidobacteriota bacterium]
MDISDRVPTGPVPTVIRAGLGVYYDSVNWNEQLPQKSSSTTLPR